MYRAKPKDQIDYDYLSQAFPDKCRNGFVYGQLLIDDRRNRYYICVAIVTTMNCTVANGTVTVLEVIPETICQDTKLNDKNQQKIFQHDICQVYLGAGIIMTGVVYYDKRVAAFRIDYGNGKCNLLIDILIAKGIPTWIEVIGNEFDNPELLKDE